MALLPDGGIDAQSYEQGLLEILEVLSDLQSDTTKNPSNKQLVNAYSRDHLTGIVTATVTIETTTSEMDGTGNILVSAVESFL